MSQDNYRIIVIGDPHIKLDNFPEFKEFEIKLQELIDSFKPDFIVVLGDLLHYHEKIFTPCLNKAHKFLLSLSQKAKTFVLVGNHDMINNQQFLSENHWMNPIKTLSENLTIVDKVVIYENFIFTPYVFPGRFKEALETVEYNYRSANIIFAHQEFKGCKMGAIVSESGDEWDQTLPLVISGHVHQNQWIGDNIFYTGSALQHAFGESERNIIATIVFNNREDIKIEEVDLNLPRKKIISTDIDKIGKLKLDSKTQDKIKISIRGTVEEFKSFKTSLEYKKMVKDGIKIVFKQKTYDNEKVLDENFDNILKHLILNTKDDKLYKIYEKFISV